MAVKKTQRHKKLTNREKVLRAESKKRLQAEGFIPPDKTRLNRKKFALEVMTEFEEEMSGYDGMFYLYHAIHFMVQKEMRHVSSEEVGVLKMVKLALESKKFNEEKKEKGESQYTIGEYYEQVIKPIKSL